MLSEDGGGGHFPLEKPQRTPQPTPVMKPRVLKKIPDPRPAPDLLGVDVSLEVASPRSEPRKSPRAVVPPLARAQAPAKPEATEAVSMALATASRARQGRQHAVSNGEGSSDARRYERAKARGSVRSGSSVLATPGVESLRLLKEWAPLTARRSHLGTTSSMHVVDELVEFARIRLQPADVVHLRDRLLELVDDHAHASQTSYEAAHAASASSHCLAQLNSRNGVESIPALCSSYNSWPVSTRQSFMGQLVRLAKVGVDAGFQASGGGEPGRALTARSSFHGGGGGSSPRHHHFAPVASVEMREVPIGAPVSQTTLKANAAFCIGVPRAEEPKCSAQGTARYDPTSVTEASRSCTCTGRDGDAFGIDGARHMAGTGSQLDVSRACSCTGAGR